MENAKERNKVKKTTFWLLLSCLLMVNTTVVRAQNELITYQDAYKSELAVYRQEIATFEREAQIYNRSETAENLQTVMQSAQLTLAARRGTLVQYCDYLTAMAQEYIADTEKVTELTTELQAEKAVFANLNEDFTNLTGWYQQDANFATAMAGLNQTAYQTFSWIYWSQLDEILNTYKTLVTTQKERILSEAQTEVIKEQKRKIIEESERAVLTMQTDLAEEIEARDQVNSYESYLTFKHRLDQLQATLQANLKNYAEVE